MLWLRARETYRVASYNPNLYTLIFWIKENAIDILHSSFSHSLTSYSLSFTKVISHDKCFLEQLALRDIAVKRTDKVINKGCFAPNIALQYVFIVLVFTFNTFLIWRTSPIYLNPFYWCHNIIFQIGSAPLRTPGVKTLFRCVTSQYLITPAKNSIILKLVAAKTLLFHGFIPQTLRI